MGPFRITKYALHDARLLGLLLDGRPKGENTFITFNYDTILEDAFNELNIRFDYGFAGLEQPNANKPRESPIPLLKLHGSANWGQSSRIGGITDAFRLYRDSSEMLADRAKPTLMPPTWKKSFGGPFGGIWDAAVSKLATATRIIIIGFSMPPTDMHFKYLLAAGLHNNISLRQILFVNPDTSNQLRSRAEALLRKSYMESGLIAFSKKELGAFTGFQPTDFAYPYGEATPYLAAEYFQERGEAIGTVAAFGGMEGPVTAGSDR